MKYKVWLVWLEACVSVCVHVCKCKREWGLLDGLGKYDFPLVSVAFDQAQVKSGILYADLRSKQADILLNA